MKTGTEQGNSVVVEKDDYQLHESKNEQNKGKRRCHGHQGQQHQNDCIAGEDYEDAVEKKTAKNVAKVSQHNQRANILPSESFKQSEKVIRKEVSAD